MTDTADHWEAGAFFDEPEANSLDGGSTSHGPLWHGAFPRWGHSMHTMCSYHGMFPPRLAHYFIQRYSEPGSLVVDPFSGRGTTTLQARVEGRRTISNDLSPLGYVLSAAKANPPSWDQMIKAIAHLEKLYREHAKREVDVSDDIRMLFHSETLRQLDFLRSGLLKKPMLEWSPTELMIAGIISGILHGANRADGSSAYLSISMPNTFSMSPAYVKQYIRDNNLTKANRNVFECMRDKLARLYLDAIDGAESEAFSEDASSLLGSKRVKSEGVDLLLTSPPYLDVVNYGTSNWIRLWWLGIDEVSREQGVGRAGLDSQLDHRHTYSSYVSFIEKTLRGVRRVLSRNGVGVIVIGNVASNGHVRSLAKQVWDEVGSASGLRLIDYIEDSLPTGSKVSRIWGDTKGQATDQDCILVLCHDDGSPSSRTDEISWDEPYKDGGPDAAHDRLRQHRKAS